MRKCAEFVFAVRLDGDGSLWVALQPKYGGLDGLRGQLGLDLYRGTSLEEAKQLARFLNSNIKGVSYNRGAPEGNGPL